jgi:EAL domain-containing protein (putative c-di-GMP-specific phosphodiesterase class I)
MEKEKGTKRYYLERRIRPVWIGFGILFVLAAVGIVLGIIFHKDLLLYIVAGVVVIGGIVGIICLVTISHKYSKDLESSISSMDEQLNDFSHGDMRLSSTPLKLPMAEKLQSQINEMIANYSHIRLKDEEEVSGEIKDKIKSGYIFSLDDFKKSLDKEVQNNANFRSSVLFLQAMGASKIPSKVISDLHKSILEFFPDSLVGQYDEKTFVIYVYSVGSFLSLENMCESFVASFNKLTLGTYNDVSVVYYCRIGGVVYPYTAITNLMEDGYKALEESKDVNINMGVRSVYYPHALVSETNKRVIYQASVESFEESFRKAKNYSEQVSALKTMVRWFALTSGYEVGGVLRFFDKTHEYVPLVEAGKDAETRSFSRLGESINQKVIDPFYNEGLKDLSFCASSLSELPPEMGESLHNIGVESFFFYSIAYGGEKRGLVYLTSSHKKPYLPLLSRENLNNFCVMVSSIVVSITNTAATAESDSLVDAITSRTNKYVYSIDRGTYRLTYMSDNLKRCFPNAHLGDICYSVLRTSHTSPCAHCPLAHGVDRRIIQHISPLESTVSVLQFKGIDASTATILIEQKNTSETSAGNHLLDEMLLIKNFQALSLDISHEIKLGSQGYIIGARLLETDSIMARLPGLDDNTLMASVVKNVQDAGYGELVYRYSKYEIAFLLNSYTKAKIMDFVEEISLQLSSVIEIKNVALNPKFAYSAISYPNEVSTSKEALSLVESELERSSKFGAGFLTEVDNRHPRKALRNDYISDVLTDTLSKSEMPIVLQPVMDTKAGTIIAADVLFRLYGANKETIPPSEFIPIAEKNKLVSELDLAALRSVGSLYANYGYTYFRQAGIKNIEIYTSAESVKNPFFGEKIKEIFERFKFPKGYIVFALDARNFNQLDETLPPLKKTIDALGGEIEAVDFDPALVSLDKLRSFGITRFKTEHSLIGQAISNQSDYSAFSRFIDSAERGGFLITCLGIENAEEKDLVTHLDIARSQGYLYGHPMPEKDFIKFLNYGR